MSRYLISRVLDMLPVVLLVSLAAFGLIHLVPGDPARVNLGLQASAEQVAQRRLALGLDHPLLRQYWDFISGAVRLDFGTSFSSGERVSATLLRRGSASLLLVGSSVLVSLLIAVPLGMIAAVRRGKWIDQAIRLVSTITFVIPAFWLGLLLIMVVSLRMDLLPTSGYGDTFAEHLRHLVLPAVTLGLGLSPVLLRLLRSSMIETMRSEFVEAARARGLSELRVMVKHVLRNSAMSTVTMLGALLGVLLSATVVIEQIFAIPGLGSLLVSSVAYRDYPVVQALTLVFGVAVPIAGVLTDLAYAALDPRVRL